MSQLKPRRLTSVRRTANAVPASEGDRLQNGRRLIGFGGAIRVRSIAPIASPSFWKSRFSRLTICRGVIYATRPPHNATQLQLSYSKK